MIDPQVFTAVESAAKAVALGSAGSRRRFDAAVLNDPDVRAVMQEVRGSGASAVQVANRLRTLADLPGNVEYQHPHDVAIAAYLRILDVLRPDLAESVAPRVAGLSNVWWPRPLALRLLEAWRTRSEAAATQSIVWFPQMGGDATLAYATSSWGLTFPDFHGQIFSLYVTDFAEHAGGNPFVWINWPAEYPVEPPTIEVRVQAGSASNVSETGNIMEAA